MRLQDAPSPVVRAPRPWQGSLEICQRVFQNLGVGAFFFEPVDQLLSPDGQAIDPLQAGGLPIQQAQFALVEPFQPGRPLLLVPRCIRGAGVWIAGGFTACGPAAAWTVASGKISAAPPTRPARKPARMIC